MGENETKYKVYHNIPKQFAESKQFLNYMQYNAKGESVLEMLEKTLSVRKSNDNDSTHLLAKGIN